MSLYKAIKSGKEKRKPYRRSKAFDPSCRNHGACGYCKDNRTHFDKRTRLAAEEEIEEYLDSGYLDEYDDYYTETKKLRKGINNFLMSEHNKPVIQKFFDSCPAKAEISFVRGNYNHKYSEDGENMIPESEENDPCIIIQWSEKGRGFGEYAFIRKDSKWIIDNECDGKEAIKRVLCSLVDSLELRDN